MVSMVVPLLAQPANNRGYYRFPALHGDTVVFTSEGDLWTVSVGGGLARRLTSHPASESEAHFSPDGTTLLFTASYEGSREVYTMPASGGLPKRLTFGGGAAAGWTPDGHPIISTGGYSTLPDRQLAVIGEHDKLRLIPLSQAAQGSFEPSGKTLFFTRQRFQGSQAKRYEGGTAENLWKFTEGSEAVPLTPDYAGTSKEALVWKGRVYFASDRDGTMNLWSMDFNGKSLRQHTRHSGWDLFNLSLDAGRIVYQMGADLYLFDVASGSDRKIDIQLPSDFDQMRERWVKNPKEYMTSLSLAHDGNELTITSRGRVFVAPVKQGRLVEATAKKQARFRNGVLMADGKSVLALSSESGELEIWKLPANGVGDGERLTTDGHVLRWDVKPSPDGKYALHSDKDNQLWLLEIASRTQRKLATSNHDGNSSPVFRDIEWSPDSRWFSFTMAASNTFDQVWLGNTETGKLTEVTTDRYNSGEAAWSPDGKFLYFLSDRALKSVVPAPWGPRQPDPYFDRPMKIYLIPLKAGTRSPFEPPDELHPPSTEPDKPQDKKANDPDKKESPAATIVDLDGIATRLQEVPVPPGNYSILTAPEKRLCWMNRDRTAGKSSLQCVDVNNQGDKPETLLEEIRDYQLSGNGKKMLVRKGEDLFVFAANAKEAALKTPKTLADAKVDLGGWTFSVIPSEEFREAFLDAWRLHRDYFYDKQMHGVNWSAMRDKYGELIGRIRDRTELSDLIAQMVSELSVLHTFVGGGDLRPSPDDIPVATLGAVLERDDAQGGWVVKHVYQSDPDRPDRLSPLARPAVSVKSGDVILSINGTGTMSAVHPYELLRKQADKQVLLRVKSAQGGAIREVVVRPLKLDQDADLRYHEWEYTRRLEVEKASTGRIGYVHLRAMGAGDIAQFAEMYYPVFQRQGLILDARHNRGGNIDSWILDKLSRKAWMYWQPRQGDPAWNMQFAFRGHMVVLVDEWTASDGEAFAEGFRRLGLGKVIGTRTWGGEIWLTASNTLADRGIASAAEIGVYGPEGKWLIEGHGVDPDLVVDNLPHATFEGKDAQLEAAIRYLEEQIRKQPVTVPAAPGYPDKSLRPSAASGARD